MDWVDNKNVLKKVWYLHRTNDQSLYPGIKLCQMDQNKPIKLLKTKRNFNQNGEKFIELNIYFVKTGDNWWWKKLYLPRGQINSHPLGPIVAPRTQKHFQISIKLSLRSVLWGLLQTPLVKQIFRNKPAQYLTSKLPNIDSLPCKQQDELKVTETPSSSSRSQWNQIPLVQSELFILW